MLVHFDYNTLYLQLSSGIGNRIPPILFAARLLHIGRINKVIIIWNQANCSQFDLTDLFNIKSDKIEIIDKAPELTLSSQEYRPAKISWWQYYTPGQPCFSIYPIIDKSDINISNDEIIKQMWKAYPNYLEIKPELLQEANNFPISNDHIGIHCRRTDVYLNEIRKINCDDLLLKLARLQDRMSISALKRILKPSDKVFVASDDKLTKEHYQKELPNAIVRNTTLPKGMWEIHSNAQKFGRWGQVYRSNKHIVESFIELLILARCNKIITDYSSTYALTAYYLLQTPVFMIKPKDPLIIKSAGKIY